MRKLSAVLIVCTVSTALIAVAQDQSQTGSTGASGATTSGQQQSGAAAQSGSQPASTGETQVLIDPGKIYNADRPTEWIGKSVQLQNALVTDLNDMGSFWVGVGGKQRLLVTKNLDDPNQKALEVKKGDVVNVFGVVQPATDEWAAKTQEEKGTMRDAMNSSGVFLHASNISIASSTAK